MKNKKLELCKVLLLSDALVKLYYNIYKCTDECIICYEHNLSNYTSCHNCKAYVHTKCINQWLYDKYYKTCPYCREEWKFMTHIYYDPNNKEEYHSIMTKIKGSFLE